MSRRAKLIEKYRKSDIFNLSSTELNPKKNISYIPYLSNKTDTLKTKINKENKKNY